MRGVYDIVNLILLIILLPDIIQPSETSRRRNSFKISKQKRCKVKCDSGKCIDSRFLCDGIIHCEDRSDETENRCSEVPCNATMFRCQYGGCIPQKKVCDKTSDCADNSDEMADMCLFSVDDTECDFKCISGECLQFRFLCDGNPDCTDGSDETRERCGGIHCPSYLFQCDYGVCISRGNVCDGERNCADGSDEKTQDCIQSRNPGICNKYEFRCNNGQCIDTSNACDGAKTCEDGSDETEDTCATLICAEYLYTCAYGACVTHNARCNGRSDCADGSDEINCGFGFAPVPVIATNESRSGCLLPPHPANGKYKLFNRNAYLNHTKVNWLTSLNLVCSSGYIRRGEHHFICLNDTWIPSLDQGYCLRTCPPLESTETYEVSCNLLGRPVSCRESEIKTVAKVTCKPKYFYKSTMPSLLCLTNGSWDQQPRSCQPVFTGPGCLLPQHVSGGKYQLLTGNAYIENNLTPLTTGINLTCSRGYVPSQTQYFFCLNNTWLPRLEKGYCIRTCPTLTSTDSYRVRCDLYNQPVNCENPIENTTAKAICQPFFKHSNDLQIVVCQNGKWSSFLIPCQPVCGQKIVNISPLINGGSDAVQGEYPWVVAIYVESSEVELICGGTIISRFYILTAAHCFKNDFMFKTEFFTIVAGKYFRNLTINEGGIQIRKVKNLYIHEDYRGTLHGYRDDIALIEVDEKFELTPQVQLVCVDWDNKYEEQDFRDNNTAVIAGWGLTKETKTPSEVLKKLVVPFRSREVCRRDFKKDFVERFVERNKICAGYQNRSSNICMGDSGGGLYFRSLKATFFVRGIASLTPRHNGGCDSNDYGLYTKVSSYLDWIGQITRRVTYCNAIIRIYILEYK